IDLLVSDAELAERKAVWQAPQPKITKGYLSRYARMVKSASTGAIVE
ncbi:MAG TPA: dihydroxy-acid dehydratase, partial [Bacillota bacterium]|nr:dihydroxy-acid dehydratase [Bacillota bacterium]